MDRLSKILTAASLLAGILCEPHSASGEPTADAELSNVRIGIGVDRFKPRPFLDISFDATFLKKPSSRGYFRQTVRCTVGDKTYLDTGLILKDVTQAEAGDTLQNFEAHPFFSEGLPGVPERCDITISLGTIVSPGTPTGIYCLERGVPTYGKCVVSTPEAPTPDVRAPEPKPEPPAQAARKTEVTLNSIPPCKVVLDGKPLGDTPQKLAIDAGKHTALFINNEQGMRESVSFATNGEATRLVIAKRKPPARGR